MSTRSLHAHSPATYYVDCQSGHDSNAGTSDTAAWRSIDRANQAELQPGDRLLFKRGCSWQGPLKAAWHGTAAQPVTLSAYGSGPRPVIQDAYSGNIQISGTYQVIEYLETTLTYAPNPDPACEQQPVAWKVGFAFGDGSSYNTLQHSKASKLAIGVYLDHGSHHNRVLHNQLVENHVVWKLDQQQALGAMGILLHGDYHEIAYNYFHRNQTICTYNGIVESNSIELYGARYANIHHNSSYADRVFSELGSSADYPASDNVYAYNLHVPGEHLSQLGSRFLVTRGEGHTHGPVWRTRVYNNTVVHTAAGSKGIACQFCSEAILAVQNNIFAVNREPISSDGPFIEGNNLYWAPAGNVLMHFSMHPSSHIADPDFVDPAAFDFRLKSTSVAINTGHRDVLSLGYTVDLQQITVPQASAVDIGAFEVPLALQLPAVRPAALFMPQVLR